MTITLSIPALAPGLNGRRGLMRMHYHAYRKVRESWSVMVIAALRAHPRWRRVDLPLTQRMEIRIERLYASNALDLDNLFASAKVPLDALRRSGIIIDDDPSVVTALACTQTKVARRAMQATIITLVIARTP